MGLVEGGRMELETVRNEHFQLYEGDYNCFVYYVEAVSVNKIKIGISERPSKRLKELQSSSPTLLKLIYFEPGDRKEEVFLHRQFAKNNTNGEWFNYTPQIKRFVEARKNANLFCTACDSIIEFELRSPNRNLCELCGDKKKRQSSERSATLKLIESGSLCDECINSLNTKYFTWFGSSIEEALCRRQR